MSWCVAQKFFFPLFTSLPHVSSGSRIHNMWNGLFFTSLRDNLICFFNLLGIVSDETMYVHGAFANIGFLWQGLLVFSFFSTYNASWRCMLCAIKEICLFLLKKCETVPKCQKSYIWKIFLWLWGKKRVMLRPIW